MDEMNTAVKTDAFDFDADYDDEVTGIVKPGPTTWILTP